MNKHNDLTRKAIDGLLCFAFLIEACVSPAFGETLNHTGSTINSYQYTGQQLDSSTGLYDLRSRYYDPDTGSFLSQDTYPYNVDNPAQLNRYSYTANNPVNWIDPLGLQAFAEYAMLQQKNERQSEAEGEAYASEANTFVDDAGNTCFNSFSADTEVATDEGDKAISEIQIGDYVLAWNEETGEINFYPVTDTIHHTDEVVIHLTIDGEEIETTPEHPFYVEGKGWVEAKDLKVGDDIRNAEGETGEVEKITTEQVTQEMYNLTVDKAHTFYVGDGQWLVHNECVDNITRNWETMSPDDPACQSGCEEVAEKVQEYIGGDIYRLTPNQELAPGAQSLGPFDGYNTGWNYHEVVVKNARVYDAFTGYKGNALTSYLARWDYADAIIWTLK